MKLEENGRLKAAHQIEEILTRNLVLAILSGMIGDSQMGRYLKSPRERWFYARFSALFERMLERKTNTGEQQLLQQGASLRRVGRPFPRRGRLFPLHIESRGFGR